jgi:hypothetical protein
MCGSPPDYSKHMHTPITAVQLNVSVTTQYNILLSLTYNYNKTPKFFSDKTAVGAN